MKTKINIAELRTQAARLPREIPDFTRIAPVASERRLSPEARALLTAFKPLLDTVDWPSEVAGSEQYRKHFELSHKLLVAVMLRNVTRIGNKAWSAESTLAGSECPFDQPHLTVGRLTRHDAAHLEVSHGKGESDGGTLA